MFLELTLNTANGSLFSIHLRTVIASQRSLSYHHLVFPTATQNIIKPEVRFTVVTSETHGMSKDSYQKAALHDYNFLNMQLNIYMIKVKTISL